MATKKRRYNEAVAMLDPEARYAPDEAIGLAKKTATAKFDETIELHIRTGADPRYADQMVRGVAVLPHGVGKPVRVLVFCQGEAETIAREAGADFVGSDDLIQEIQDGFLGFDVSIATPDLMGRIGRLGRILGRRGLMPNPRTGTVVQPDAIPQAVSDAKKGARGVPARQDGADSLPHRQGVLRGRQPDGQPDDTHGQRDPLQARRRQGPVHPRRPPHRYDGAKRADGR